MRVFLNSIVGIDDAIVSMQMSKRSWTREKEIEIRKTVKEVFDPVTGIHNNYSPDSFLKFDRWMKKLTSIGICHITLLRFIDFSITVEGVHRGGQDDWDSHAERFDNRIVRSSTRLATFGNEKSTYYADKILSTDDALAILGLSLPETVKRDGVTYVRATNGYIREDYVDSNDVKRGLYMLSIPSNFIFKINLTEWAHVYKERNKDGSANPEVKELCEAIADLIEHQTISYFDRGLFKAIKN